MMSIEHSGSILILPPIVTIFLQGFRRKPPSLSELTPMISNTELTHLGSEASKYLIYAYAIGNDIAFFNFIKQSNNFMKLWRPEGHCYLNCIDVMLCRHIGFYINSIQRTWKLDFVI